MLATTILAGSLRRHRCLLAMIMALAWLPAGQCIAGQFKRSLGRGESLKVKLPVVPAVRIGRATLAIDVKDATGADPDTAGSTESETAIRTPPVTQLQAALDAAFRESFTIVQSKGETLLRVAVVHYTPVDSAIRTVVQKVRAAAEDGSPITREIAVEQWVAKGHIAVRVEVVDASGALLDGFAPQASVKGVTVVSVDGVDRVDRTQMPTSEAVLNKLVSDLVIQFQPRYCPPATELEIPLAVDEELRPGNQLARNGDLPGAVKSWEAAVLSRQPSGADRIHNIGTAYEVQAYDMLLKQQELGKIKPYLDRAAKQYAESAVLDPEEKYVTRAVERVKKALGLIETMEELEQQRQKSLAAKTQPSPWPPGAAGAVQAPVPMAIEVVEESAPPAGVETKGGSVAVAHDPAAEEALARALNDPRPDTPQEATFRQFVVLRLRSADGPLDEVTKRQIEAAGPLAYGLTPLSAKRVVYQEAHAWTVAQPKIASYRESYLSFAMDGSISPEERQVLATLAKNLGLGEADVKRIEDSGKVR